MRLKKSWRWPGARSGRTKPSQSPRERERERDDKEMEAAAAAAPKPEKQSHLQQIRFFITNSLLFQLTLKEGQRRRVMSSLCYDFKAAEKSRS